MENLKKIFQQTSWQLIGKIASSISTLLTLAIVTRSYGPLGTGIYTLAVTYLAFFYLAADLGLNGYILPKLSQKKDEANKLFNFRLVWSIFLISLANLIALFLPFKEPLFNQAVFLGSLTILSSAIFNSANLIFQSRLNYERSSLASAAGSLAIIPIVLVLSRTNLPVSFLILGLLGGWVINNIFCLWLVFKEYKFSLTFPDYKYPLQLLKSAWPVSLTLVLNTVYFRIDAFILSGAYSFKEVGSYNLAYQLFQSALVIPTFIMNSYYPLMLDQLEKNRRNFFEQLKFASLILLGLGAIAAVLTFILAPWLILILAGPNFADSTSSLIILSLSFPAYFLSSLFMWSMMSLKKYRPMFVIYLVGLISNVGLNLLFIPSYSFIAASWITGISEYLILLLQAFILWQEYKQSLK